MPPEPVRRRSWGCGAGREPGWINSDVEERAGIDLACELDSVFVEAVK